MILHTINKPEALSKCLAMIGDDDTVLLIEDGVYLAASNALPVNVSVKAIAADVVARGFGERLPENIEQVSYEQFVQIAVAATQTCNWF